ncbi:MAG: hypothetical protein LUO91_05460 [Methanomicrobiales archaeon]|nr:hypothetical protein [Methanomicrobiales archaeon]
MTFGGRERDLFRQGMNLVFSFAQFLVTLLPALGIGTGIGDRASGGEPLVQPIFWAFFIWFPIYAACIAYGIYQAIPAQRENGILRRIGFPTASAFTGVTAYALVAQFGGSDWLLIAIFVWILASLLMAYLPLGEYRHRLTRTEGYLVLAPVSLLTGWVSLAILVNLAAVLKDDRVITAGVMETAFSLVLLVAACLVASLLIHRGKGNAWYAFPVIWGLGGVVVANVMRQSSTIIAVAAGLAALEILVFLLVVRKRESEQAKGIPNRKPG